MLAVVYAGLSHYCNALGGPRELGAVLALAPPLLGAVLAAWRWAPAAVALAATLAVAALARHFWPFLRENFPLIYLIQDTTLYGLMGWTFSRSLLPGRQALCTGFADRLHGPLTAAEIRYTRQVTAAWAAFFFATAALSVGLFLIGPLRLWSVFVNFCVLPLVGLMFAAEARVRRRLLPEVHDAGILAMLRMYRATPPS